MDLHGKTAIVTGASGQLGCEIALCLGRRGMNCVSHYHIHEAAARQVVDEILAMGCKAVG